MTNLRFLRVSRDQLKQFLPTHELIKEFENLFAKDTEITVIVNNIIGGAGLDGEGNYIQRIDSNYLDLSETIYEDSTILDTQLFNNIRELIIPTSTNIILSATSQTIISDASTQEINITLPDPSSCYSDNRSFRIAIYKKDSSSNQVNIMPFGSELIIGESIISLEASIEVVNLITDGTDWYLGA